VREYETTFIVQPEIGDEAREALYARVESVISRAGGERLFWDDAGKRKLAYEIRRFQKGHYQTINYLDSGPAVKELERALRYDDSVLRYLTVLVNDAVEDLEARRAEALEQEKVRKQRAAERAAREAELERERERDEAARARGDDSGDSDDDGDGRDEDRDEDDE
jgi:small subunit ribosomal protein S6